MAVSNVNLRLLLGSARLLGKYCLLHSLARQGFPNMSSGKDIESCWHCQSMTSLSSRVITVSFWLRLSEACLCRILNRTCASEWKDCC